MSYEYKTHDLEELSLGDRWLHGNSESIAFPYKKEDKLRCVSWLEWLLLTHVTCRRKNRSVEPKLLPKVVGSSQATLTSGPDLPQLGSCALFTFLGMAALKGGCLGFPPRLMQTEGSCLLPRSCAIHCWSMNCPWLFIFLEQQRDWVESWRQVENTSCASHCLFLCHLRTNLRLPNGLLFSTRLRGHLQAVPQLRPPGISSMLNTNLADLQLIWITPGILVSALLRGFSGTSPQNDTGLVFL